MMLFVNTEDESGEVTEMELVNRHYLLKKAEDCRETTDAFIELINEVPGYKYYWRVVIFPKRDDGAFEGPILEVAGFINETIAKSYIESIVKKDPAWDDTKLGCCALMYELPPWTVPDDNLSAKIKCLLNRG